MRLGSVTSLPSIHRRAVRLLSSLVHEVGIPDGPGLMLICEDRVAIARRFGLPLPAVRTLLSTLDDGVIVKQNSIGITVSLEALSKARGAEGLTATVFRRVDSFAPTAPLATAR